MVVFLAWLFGAFIVAALGSSREIGFGKSLLISLLLSPLIGALFVATSTRTVNERPPGDRPLPKGVQRLIDRGDYKFTRGDYDSALSDYTTVLTLQRKAPNTHFKIAKIHSIKKQTAEAYAHLSKAVEDGFDEFHRIMNSESLAYLREQKGFQEFAQGGYKFPDAPADGGDTISKLERLAHLKDKGVLTDREFEEQKKRILGN